MKTEKKRRVTPREQKQIMLEIMDFIHGVCREHGIRYSLFYGTMLGAVRHGGYIPWDDDMDICMLREDYNRFLRTVSGMEDAPFRLVSIDTDPCYYMLIPKMIDRRTTLTERIPQPYPLGVWVDIFIIDYLSDDYRQACRIQRKLQFYTNLLMPGYIGDREGRGKLKQLVLAAGVSFQRFLNRPRILRKMDSMVRNNPQSLYCGSVIENDSGKRLIMPTAWYRETEEMAFEGRVYCVYRHYDDILKKLYGNYMQLPPEENRTSTHAFDAYWNPEEAEHP